MNYFHKTLYLSWCKYPVQKRKSGLHNRIWHLQINSRTNFFHKKTVLSFEWKLPKKSILCSNRKKVGITIEFSIFELIWIPNFILNRQSRFSGPNLPKMGILGKSRKIEHQHKYRQFELVWMPNFISNK